ncbi:EGF-like domain [Trinorchestia longiramus]|nr:EGF-like domain [Trinorchestia longiramus]
MQVLYLYLILGLGSQVLGASDDHHVEQVRSPHVSAFDLGTHMTSGHLAPASKFDGYQADFGPYGRSVKHEVQEEQQFVNGQPVYEKRHERRYEDGRLVHQDGHERGNPSTGPVVVVPGGYTSSSSSRSAYSSSHSGGGFGTAGSSFESIGVSDDFENNFRKDVHRLRERLHQGTSVIHAPAQTTSVRDEKRHESHFVDGQQVYRNNEERRYEDGRLVHNIAEEEGSRNAGAQLLPGGVNSLTSRQSSNRETASSLVRSGANYDSPPNTAYRASYWRPGPQERRVSTSHRQTTTNNSSVYRPRANRIRTSTASTRDGGSNPIHVSYRPSSHVVAGTNQPSYRTSYTPSRTIERVPQRQSAVSTLTSTSSQTRQHSNTQHYPAVPVTTLSNSRAEIEASSYESRQLSSDSEYEQQQENENESSESGYTRRQLSTAYGSGRYVQRPSTTTPVPRTASRITDTYSVPYSIRSPSYQPSQFANYSAWSHWKKESTAPVHTVSSSSSHNRYNSESDYLQNTDQLSQSSEHDNDESDSGYVSSDSSRRTQQSQHVRMLRPGFLYEDRLDQSNDVNSDSNRRSELYQSSSTNAVHTSDHTMNRPSSYSSPSSDYLSRSSSVEPGRPVDAAIGSGSGGSTSLSFTVDVGEGENVRLGNLNSVNTQTDQERYDISPLVDGSSSLPDADNEVVTSYSGEKSTSSVVNSRQPSHYSSHRQHGRTSTAYNSIPSSGSAYDRSTHVRNQTRNTFTSQIQPLVSSYKTETRTSRRYLNGKLVSETRFNRYYENGVLVHENQTEMSRDEMATDGINVSALDLSLEDLARYGVVDTNAVPVAHSQRLDFRQEKEFIDGNQVYESTHERRFQDGELIHEDHEERDKDELAALGRTIYDQDDSDLLGFGHEMIGRGSYNSNFIRNRNYGHSVDTGNYDGYRSGHRQRTGVGETVTVNVTPVTKTRKTEIRREQEFQDGQQVYDLHHERQFTDGNLIHEQYSEKGPGELGTVGHRDALQDILTGQTLATASETNYRPASSIASQNHHSQYDDSYTTQAQGQSGTADYSSSTYQQANSRTGHAYGTQDSSSNYQGATVQSGRDRELVGTNLLTSGASTYVIGGGGIENFESLNSASSLSEGHAVSADSSLEDGAQYNSDGSRRVSGGYYGSFGSNNAVGSQSRSSSSYSSEQSSAHSSSQQPTNDGTYGTSGYDAFGNFEAYASGDRTGGRAISHRREMEVEEHYENGQLVRGHEKDKEWKNNQLLRHDERVYGEGDARRGQAASTVISPGLTSSTNFATHGSSSEGYGATASFSAYSPGYTSGSDAQYSSQASGHQSQSAEYGAHSGYQTQSSYGAGSSVHGSQHAGFGVTGYPAGGYRSHRREMEVEEHYENGQLVRGREEQKEWKDDDLLRHERRHYGEGHPNESSASSSRSSSSVFRNSLTGQCSDRPCLNGASCITGTRGYLCVCTFGFRGEYCILYN